MKINKKKFLNQINSYQINSYIEILFDLHNDNLNYRYNRSVNINSLIGKTVHSIKFDEKKVLINFSDKSEFEIVNSGLKLDSIISDPKNLENSEIIYASKDYYSNGNLVILKLNKITLYYKNNNIFSNCNCENCCCDENYVTINHIKFSEKEKEIEMNQILENLKIQFKKQAVISAALEDHDDPRFSFGKLYGAVFADLNKNKNTEGAKIIADCISEFLKSIKDELMDAYCDAYVKAKSLIE